MNFRNLFISVALLAAALACTARIIKPAEQAPAAVTATAAPVPAPPPPDVSQEQNLPAVALHVGPALLHTQIASTPEEQEKGLMFYPSLPDNDGMIFLLPEVGPATFWMKNTLIPLSVAYIDRNGVILEIHDMKPLDTSITRSDSDQVAYALEANLHWFALNGVKPGDRIDPPPATLAHAAP
jgi:uncharacterized membrane protein (UPF0127 family)